MNASRSTQRRRRPSPHCARRCDRAGSPSTSWSTTDTTWQRPAHRASPRGRSSSAVPPPGRSYSRETSRLRSTYLFASRSLPPSPAEANRPPRHAFTAARRSRRARGRLHGGASGSCRAHPRRAREIGGSFTPRQSELAAARQARGTQDQHQSHDRREEDEPRSLRQRELEAEMDSGFGLAEE